MYICLQGFQRFFLFLVFFFFFFFFFFFLIISFLNIPVIDQTFLVDLIGESPPANVVSRQTRGGKSKLQQLIGQRQIARVTDDSTATMFSVSMRHAFVPFKGKLYIFSSHTKSSTYSNTIF